MESLAGPPNGQGPAIVGSVMALNNDPISIDPIRLQRVPDVMLLFGLLSRSFNIKNMLYSQ